MFITSQIIGQESLDYQKPPQDILDLVDVELAPRVMLDNDKNYMILSYRDAFKSMAELSEEELRLAGLRINPKTNIGSRTNYYNNIKIKNLKTKDSRIIQVEGLPTNPRLANYSWSPNQKMMAMTHTTLTGVELWVINIAEAKAKKLSDATLNANLGDVINWTTDNSAVLAKFLPSKRSNLIDADAVVPTGPTISISDGKKAQNRTYQDLLKNKTDEQNFESLAQSELYRVDLDGTKTPWLKSGMYRNVTFSPDGKYVMVSEIKRPFSYLVPYRRFPTSYTIYDTDANLISEVENVPLIEDLPKGFMAARKGRRNLQWRADKPSTIVYAEVLDEGDPEKEVEYRDQIFLLEAPFTGKGKSILKTKNRFYDVEWATDELAIAYDYWWNDRNLKTYTFNPSDPTEAPVIINDRNYQDRYSDPGQFVSKRNKYGRYVIDIKDDEVHLLGDGFSEEGQFPFVDKMNLKTQKTERIYQSTFTDKIENINNYYSESNQILVRIESPNEYPNYYYRDLKSGSLQQITSFNNPFQSIESIHKEVITYQREDGLELTGTLYLPLGYDMEKKEKMPMILWAYPREFKDKNSASQNTSNPNEFTYPFWGTPLYWVTQGYVVLDDAAFPIVGEGDEEPNDSFRSQLVANGKAAIDAVDKLGYIDRNKVAVGGHSYGAFMVANLLSHSDHYAAGIARSGAYNRTLTPFGFQSEERNYWEAPEVYYTMSPFMHADKMKTPLLLVHGEADNNSGTYPLQSERYFNALKGLGATVRLVMLPKESHGYRAKESILHLLWEQHEWLEKHVKNRVTD